MIDVLLHVQHLLGIGHLRRAALLAKALDRAGLSVAVVSGGLPVPDLDIGGADLVQLPAMKSADALFSGLVDEAGRPVDEDWKAERRDRLLETFERLRPRMLLLELFPFGRRQLRFELLPLLEASERRSPRPSIVCSLRDVLNPIGNPEKEAWILNTARRFFDRILVHGDPDFLPLDESFPAATEIEDLLFYTGYVAPSPPDLESISEPDKGEVLVSTGGGAVAAPLIGQALAARPQTRLSDRPWRILAGHGLAETAFQRFLAEAPPGVLIERSRSDFPTLLSRCVLSISQGGYNTVMEVLSADRPAVIVPFATESEREQTLRAERLAERGLITLAKCGSSDGSALARAVDQAPENYGVRTKGRPKLNMQGTENSAKMIADLLAEGQR